MTYTQLALAGVLTAVAVDLLVLRVGLLRRRMFWVSYGLVLFFQLLTNGWLTGRGIVRYDPATIVGSAEPVFLGSGRVVYAPVEDLAFGFALVLWTLDVWVWLGRRGAGGRAI